MPRRRQTPCLLMHQMCCSVQLRAGLLIAPLSFWSRRSFQWLRAVPGGWPPAPSGEPQCAPQSPHLQVHCRENPRLQRLPQNPPRERRGGTGGRWHAAPGQQCRKLGLKLLGLMAGLHPVCLLGWQGLQVLDQKLGLGVQLADQPPHSGLLAENC